MHYCNARTTPRQGIRKAIRVRCHRQARWGHMSRRGHVHWRSPQANGGTEGDLFRDPKHASEYPRNGHTSPMVCEALNSAQHDVHATPCAVFSIVVHDSMLM